MEEAAEVRGGWLEEAAGVRGAAHSRGREHEGTTGAARVAERVRGADLRIARLVIRIEGAVIDDVAAHILTGTSQAESGQGQVEA